jgi:nickel/cobalt exporter
MRRVALIVLFFWVQSLPARAHDIPSARVDRSIQAALAPGQLRIDYEVSLSELTLVQDLRMLIATLPGAERRDWFMAYGRETGPLNARGMRVVVDGRPLDVRFLGFDLEVEEHPRYQFHFEVKTPPHGRLTIQDTNYVASEGTSRLAIRGLDGVTIRGDDLPTDVAAIPIQPVWQLSEAEERRTKQVTVDYATPASPIPLDTTPNNDRSGPSLPPLPTRPRPAIESGSDSGVRALTRLLERTSAVSLWGLVALALGLGALHALQPGHGKTLVAATVLGDRGTWFRGIVLALLTTLTHTGSVLLVAFGLYWTRTTRYGEIHLGLTRAAGCLIAGIGLWRLGRHLAGYGEHDDHDGVEGTPSATGRGIVGLGVAGGLVPCWDAVVLIVLAEATGRLALGIGLLLAFGLGMAMVLIAVGVLAARFRRLVVRGPAGASSYGHWERRLGILSGLILAAIGVYLLGIA